MLSAFGITATYLATFLAAMLAAFVTVCIVHIMSSSIYVCFAISPNASSSVTFAGIENKPTNTICPIQT
jgi:hypothetical protein